MTNYLFLLISTALFLAAIVSRKTVTKVDLVAAAIFIPGFLLLSILFLVADYFTGVGVDASVIYHLKYGLYGAGFLEYKLLIITTIIAILLTAAGSFYLIKKHFRISKRTKLTQNASFYIVLILAFLASPSMHGLLRPSMNGLLGWNEAQQLNFYEHYRFPDLEPLSSAKKNLVYIYAEGLERTYFDEATFPGLVPNLKALESVGTSFTNISQVNGTGWTIAGLTATQCGIPLFTPSHGNSMSGLEDFLPNAICVGDLLSDEGYNLEYISGSSTYFAGTEKFFSTHGFNYIKGREFLSKIIPVDPYINGWGYYDDELFEIALKELDDLHAEEKPFAVFISTMDTHPPGEKLSASCDDRKYLDGRNDMLNAVACADLVISRFLNKIFASSYAEDTVVVISSDHLAMRNSATSMLRKLERRNLFLMLETEKNGATVDKPGSILDVAPTWLTALGYKGELGLGRDLLSDDEPLITKIPDFDRVLNSWAVNLGDFWGFPKVTSWDDYEIFPDRKSIKINKRTYHYPLLVEFEDNDETIMRFDSNHEGQKLIDYVWKMNDGKAFLWVDKCKAMRSLSMARFDQDCVMYGRAGSGGIEQFVLETETLISVKSITEKAALPVNVRTSAEIDVNAKDSSRFIAHAGGEIDGHKYTNSLEAMDHHYKKGFRLFELDIIETSDEVYVAAHDWEHWQKLTGFEGELPPVRDGFNSSQLLDKYTPMDMETINHWFEQHPDAILVTDKINTPLDFANQFVDKKRLMMELFSLKAVKEGVAAGIRSAMPSWDILVNIKGDITQSLVDLGVTDVAASRRVIKNNLKLLDEFKKQGIRVYVFHVNSGENSDEQFVVCNDMEHVYGLYADNYDFANVATCK
ncbi:MAG: hypothetical protein DRQ48_09150 [Gammaproteobacteria bacterium]|nr:MAG: hypothetical protein DRQ48_09150 [Gammaproteobacteria bacterium]